MTRPIGLPPSSYTEKEWQKQVIELLKMYGWDWWYYVTRPRMSPWGWPDLVAVRRRDRRILFAELKTQSGKPSPEQLGVLELLLDVAGGGYRGAPTEGFARDGCHVDVELWRPGDIERVMEVLK